MNTFSRHWRAIADIDGLGPYFRPEHSIHVGCRAGDEELVETRGLLHAVVTAAQVAEDGAELVSATLSELMMTERLDGYWLHLDVDVLDPSIMPAVDSPDPDGLSAARLRLCTPLRRVNDFDRSRTTTADEEDKPCSLGSREKKNRTETH